MKKLSIILAIMFVVAVASSCFQGLSDKDYTAQTSAMGSFYVDNPFDTLSNDIQSVVDTLYDVIGDSTALGQMIFFGSGSPEGVVSARIGALYSRLDAGASDSALYVKRYYSQTDTGWIAK